MTGSDPQSRYPQFPPGFWRGVVLVPGPGWVAGAVEDDFHHFTLRLHHLEGRITGAEARAHRHPWTGCLGAPAHLAADLEGREMAEIAASDPRPHCTHLFDLAIACAAHAHDGEPTRYDMFVGDRVDERMTAVLQRNGQDVFHWLLEGSAIRDGSAQFAGRDLRQLSAWKAELSPREAQWALMLRRAAYVAGGRVIERRVAHASQTALAPFAPCFNFRSPQVETSTRSGIEADLSASGVEPLAHFDPEREFAGDA